MCNFASQFLAIYSVKIKEVLDALEQFAPLPLQEGFDNAGLQVGLTEAEVSGALLCLDVTETIIDEAIALGCNVIVSHHPLIFHKLSQICGADFVQRIVIKAIEHKIAIISMHTNIDNVRGGVNFKIAEKMGLTNVQFLGERKTVQVVLDNGEKMVSEGASGVIGYFSQSMPAQQCVSMLKQTFHVESVMCNQLLHRDIQSVALCGGAGAFLLPDALSAHADAFVTGEMHYHDFFGHDQEIQLAVIGHYQSEQFTNEIFKSIIEERCKGVRCYLTQICTNPIIYL